MQGVSRGICHILGYDRHLEDQENRYHIFKYIFVVCLYVFLYLQIKLFSITATSCRTLKLHTNVFEIVIHSSTNINSSMFNNYKMTYV